LERNAASRKEKVLLPRSNVLLLKTNVFLNRVYVGCSFLNVDLLKPNVGQNKLRASLPRHRAASAAWSAGPASPDAAAASRVGGYPAASSATEFNIERRVATERYAASMRAGRTRTTSFSLDEATLMNLKALAARRHGGNVSALLAEVAAREAKFAAAEAYFEKYGVPPLTEEAIDEIEGEWRGEAPLKKKRRRAA
jgi:hypothetical protein